MQAGGLVVVNEAKAN